MNCIFLLLLLSCCSGWGNGSRSGCDCMTPCGNRDCRGEERGNSREGRDSGRRDFDRRESERRSGDCGCEERNSAHEKSECGCAQNDRDGRASDMIPPPWQEYPQFPRRDNGDECEE